MKKDDDDLIAELDDMLGAGGIHDLAFHVGQVKALVKHHSELVAARDHLRARLRQLIPYAQHEYGCIEPLTPCTCGLADLLAVLTEQLQEKKDTNDDLSRVGRTPS